MEQESNGWKIFVIPIHLLILNFIFYFKVRHVPQMIQKTLMVYSRNKYKFLTSE